MGLRCGPTEGCTCAAGCRSTISPAAATACAAVGPPPERAGSAPPWPDCPAPLQTPWAAGRSAACLLQSGGHAIRRWAVPSWAPEPARLAIVCSLPYTPPFQQGNSTGSTQEYQLVGGSLSAQMGSCHVCATVGAAGRGGGASLAARVTSVSQKSRRLSPGRASRPPLLHAPPAHSACSRAAGRSNAYTRPVRYGAGGPHRDSAGLDTQRTPAQSPADAILAPPHMTAPCAPPQSCPAPWWHQAPAQAGWGDMRSGFLVQPCDHLQLLAHTRRSSPRRLCSCTECCMTA